MALTNPRTEQLTGSTLSLGNSSISVDSSTGYVVVVPAPTEGTPNPKATVFSSNGVATVETTAGVANSSQVSSAASSVISGGGGSSASATKTYRFQGRLGIHTGEIRKYFTSNASMSTIDAFVSVAPQGSNINVVVKKNNSNAESFSIASNTTSNTAISANTSFVSGDYMTVDITQVGSSFAGQDLYVVFNF